MATTDDLPEFSEMCKAARELERKLITIAPSQISGGLSSEGGSEIFPREFDEFTYAYLLNESHKVERKIFATTYGAQLSGGQAAPGARIDGRQMELELQKFSASAPALQPEEAGKKPGGLPIPIPKIPVPQLRVPIPIGGSAPQQKQQAAPKPPAISPSQPAPPAQSEIDIARDSEAAGESQMKAHTYSFPAIPPLPKQMPPPLPKQSGAGAADVPEIGEEKSDVPQVPDEERAPLPAAKPRASDEEQDADEAKFEPLSQQPQPTMAEGEKSKAPMSSLSSSKISPRLRAIIEEKLRREEARADAQKAASEEIEKPLAPSSQEQAEEDEAPVLSARERMLRRLQNDKGAPRASGRTGAEFPEGLGEEEAAPSAGKSEARDDSGQEKEEGGEPQAAKIAPVIPPEEKQEGGEEEYAHFLSSDRRKTSAKPETAMAETAADRQVAAQVTRPGGIIIKPMFGDEETRKENEKDAEAEAPGNDERMNRIQRIIDELSPDRQKASAIQKKEPLEQPAKSKAIAKPAGRKKENAPELSEEAPEETGAGAPSQPEDETAEPQDAAWGGQSEAETQMPIAAIPQKESAKQISKKKTAAKKQAAGKQKPAAKKEIPVAKKKAPGPQAKSPQAASAPAAAVAPSAQQPQKKPSLPAAKTSADAIAARQAQAKALLQKTAPPSTSAKAKPVPAQQLPAARAAPRASSAPAQRAQPTDSPMSRATASRAIQQTRTASAPASRAAQPAAPSPLSARTATQTRTAPPSARTIPAGQQGVPSRVLPSKPQLPSHAPPSRVIPARAPAPPLARQPPALSRTLPQQRQPPPQAGAPRQRVLPGGIAPRTYLPPARPKILPRAMPHENEEQGEAEPEQPEEIEEKQPVRPILRPSALTKPKQPPAQIPEEETPAPEDETPEQEQEETQQEEIPETESEQEPAGEQESEQVEGQPEEEAPRPQVKKPGLMGMRVTRQASDEPLGGEEKTPVQIEEEKRIAEKAAELARLSRKQKEISGEAALPAREEEELDVPAPPPDDDVPRPDYGEAKEGFKRKMESEALKEKAKDVSDAMVEQFAKESVVWLYEIYKMGGMSREEFLAKAREKMPDAAGPSPEPQVAAPENAALSNLQKEIDKKKK